MATSEDSSRSALKEIKSGFDNAKEYFVSIIGFEKSFAKDGKDIYYQYNHPNLPGEMIEYDYKEHCKQTANFLRVLDELYRKVTTLSRRKTRKGVTRISQVTILLNENLIKWVNAGDPSRFGSLRPFEDQQTGSRSGNLLDYLPRLREGFTYKNSLTILFTINARASGLADKDNGQMIQSDKYMDAIFDGDQPCHFYTFKDPQFKSTDPKEKPTVIKVTMEEALQQGKVHKPLNTFEVLRLQYPSTETNPFNKDKMRTFFFQNIAALNYYSKAYREKHDELREQNQFLEREDIKRELDQELALLKEASKQWTQINALNKKPKQKPRKSKKVQLETEMQRLALTAPPVNV